MSKLAPSLKALINAPFSRPGPCPAPARIGDVYRSIAREAAERQVGLRPWVTISAAATFTLNSPESLHILHGVASQGGPDDAAAVAAAELIREVGLKCISFNGIPRTINCLNAFHASLPASLTSQLTTTASRATTPDQLVAAQARGRRLWDSVYRPHEAKLLERLGRSHPDLPVHILQGHYAQLLADPEAEKATAAGVGRALTSLVAVASLRAQTGVGPQVLSHVYGLRKAVGDGTAEDEGGVEWLAGDEGSEWVLRVVDRIVEGLGGSNFARGREAKL